MSEQADLRRREVLEQGAFRDQGMDLRGELRRVAKMFEVRELGRAFRHGMPGLCLPPV
jgi:hypothetical protein